MTLSFSIFENKPIDSIDVAPDSYIAYLDKQRFFRHESKGNTSFENYIWSGLA